MEVGRGKTGAVPNRGWPIARIVVTFVLVNAVLVEISLGTEPVPIKKLRGKKYAEAVSARDRADLMRADLEGRLSGSPEERAKRPKISQKQIEAEAAKVVRAYQEVIDCYPHTEIAAYCALRLSGFYEFQGKFDKAAELTAQTASEFAGTSEGNMAVFEAGLIHAQARHDPAEAIKWFSRVAKPAKAAGAQYDEDDKLYLSAQEQLAKCELKLRQDNEAKDRISKLKNAYPRFTQELDRSYQFEVGARDHPGAPLLNLNQKPVLNGSQSNVYTLTALVSALVVLIAIFIFRQVRKRKAL